MSKAKHTSAPWAYEVVESEVSMFHCITKAMPDGNNRVVTFVINDNEEFLANARLIAEAPTMYEAIQEFCDRVERGEVRSKRTYTKFKELIKKIEG